MNMAEIEIKILEIQPNKIKKILKQNNAKFIKKVLQTNIIYDNSHTQNKGITVRLRKENNNTIFTVKSKTKIVNGHKIREEYEIETDDFKSIEKMLELIGLKMSAYTEAKREYWKLFDCSVEIMKMPKIPTFLEIEGKEKNIIKVAKLLGFSEKDYFAGYPPVHYKVDFKNLRF